MGDRVGCAINCCIKAFPLRSCRCRCRSLGRGATGVLLSCLASLCLQCCTSLMIRTEVFQSWWCVNWFNVSVCISGRSGHVTVCRACWMLCCSCCRCNRFKWRGWTWASAACCDVDDEGFGGVVLAVVSIVVVRGEGRGWRCRCMLFNWTAISRCLSSLCNILLISFRPLSIVSKK